jgi:hypothetical protein
MDDKEEKRVEAENAFKKLVKGWRLPAPPALPTNMLGASETDKQLWTLDQRLTALEARYTLITKIAWRTSAAVLGIIGSLAGWDWISQFLQFLGGN